MRRIAFQNALVALLLTPTQVSSFTPLLRSDKKLSFRGPLRMSGATEMDNAKGLISDAISIGAPAYNSGDIRECARVYKLTALKIRPMLPDNLRAGLEAAIDASHADDTEEAWAFRRQFDSIVEYVAPFMPEPSAVTRNGHTLEKFGDNMIPSRPLIVNDNVMGGVSQGQWLAGSNLFSGVTSLQNNGGFSSLRWRLERIQNWSYAKGIYLKVKHSNPENHTFRIILKDVTCDQVRGANFKNVFCNPDQIDDSILIPFEAFDQMEQMGRQLTGPVFNRGAVTEIGLMAIKPSVVGDFELTVEEWGLYC